MRDDFTSFDALLAVNPLHSMGARFRGSHARFGMEEIFIGLAILACVVAGAILLTRMLTREERLRRTNNPWALFRSLCRAHQLQRPEVRLLRRVARAQQLDQPARLFLEPEWIRIPRDNPRFRHDITMLEQLGQQLFADLEGLCGIRTDDEIPNDERMTKHE
ncbi:MAG: hypothetical protein ACC645_07560 [Pirellulales bacterium]